VLEGAMKNEKLFGGMLILLFSLVGPATASDDWTLTDKDGHQLRLSDFRGKWVLVNFWATWCPSCIAETAALKDLQKTHSNLVVIGIAEEYRNAKEVLDFIKEKAITYPVVLGSEDTAGDFGGLNGTPTNFLYSPNGQLIGKHEGPITQNELEQIISRPDGNVLFLTH
jgi:thiol-disulfide isomerase/thioredoxin